MYIVGFLLVLLSIQSSAVIPIENVVVVMLENRAFDHMLGYANKENPKIRGLTGHESNYIIVNDTKSHKYVVNANAPYIAYFDPDHSQAGTFHGIFGSPNGWNNGKGTPRMDGFIEANKGRSNKHDDEGALSMFSVARVPIINTLVKEFALFDAWHASVPGPTCPNRYFLESATSAGENNNDPVHLKQDTVYDRLNEIKKTWKIYHHTGVYCSMNFDTLQKPENKKNIHKIEQFYDDAKKGNLAHYSVIHPSGSVYDNKPANDQHPDHTVAGGEILMKDLYEAIRASPQWNKTLFIVTYDEHGGFYDHVHPPMKDVPSPDGKLAPNKFDFKMLGVRIPTIMISPWINKGMVIHEPNGPTPSSQFEASSIAATLKKIFGWSKFLTKRDEWAGTFESILSERTTPRTDCPMKLPPAPHIDENYVHEEGLKPINDLQRVVLSHLENLLNVVVHDKDSMNQLQFTKVQEELMNKVLNKK